MSAARPTRRELYGLARRDLVFFIRMVFQTLNPNDRYAGNWHIEAIANLLEDVVRGDVTRLIINQPPRSLKSICVTLGFPAWVIGNDPSAKFICASYSKELADKFGRDFHKIVTSDWYKRMFPRVRFARLTDSEVTTTLGGGRRATSVGGTLTGLGADFIIIDDPQKADEAYSEAARLATQEWVTGSVMSRLNDKERGAIILVMQRLHVDDLAGFLLSAGGWTHLELPAIAQETREIRVTRDLTYAFREGELLHAERESQATLDTLRATMGAMNFNAQYLQRPSSLLGNMLKWIWFKRGDPPPFYHGEIIQSWDPAMKLGANNDYSVCTTWLRLPGDEAHYLIDVFRARLSYPDLRRKILEHAKLYKARYVLIEDNNFGSAICDEFEKQSHGFRLYRIKAVQEKTVRFAAATLPIEQGKVWLPLDADWMDVFKQEMTEFPGSRHDDQADSVSQYFGWIANDQPARIVARRIKGFL